MRPVVTFVVASTLSVAALSPFALRAQQKDVGPPPILTFQAESLKPGHSGAAHAKTEAAYLAAARANKAPYHYIALSAMSGPDRALFMSSYASLAAWEEESKAAEKNPAMQAALDHAMLADGEHVSSSEENVWMHRPDLSYGEMTMHGVRYVELQVITLKPGKLQAAEEWAKMYNEGYKGVPGANWAAYQQVYGGNSNTFFFMTLLKSLSEADAELGPSSEAFVKAMGPEKMKKLHALEAEVAATEQTNLYRIDPKMSLPFEGLIADEPEFWKPKAAAMPMKKAEEKPKQ